MAFKWSLEGLYAGYGRYAGRSIRSVSSNNQMDGNFVTDIVDRLNVTRMPKND